MDAFFLILTLLSARRHHMSDPSRNRLTPDSPDITVRRRYGPSVSVGDGRVGEMLVDPWQEEHKYLVPASIPLERSRFEPSVTSLHLLPRVCMGSLFVGHRHFHPLNK